MVRIPKASHSLPTPPAALSRLIAVFFIGSALSACAPAVYDRVDLRPSKFADLPGWHRVKKLADSCTIVTARRPGAESPDFTTLECVLMSGCARSGGFAG